MNYKNTNIFKLTRLAPCLILLLLGACNVASIPITIPAQLKGQHLTEMTFNNAAFYPLYVASYEPVAFNLRRSQLPQGFIANPSEILHGYLKNRFKARGTQGKLIISTDDVSVFRSTLETENEDTGMVIKKDHYSIGVKMSLQVIGLENDYSKPILLEAYRNIYIPEYASIKKREKIQMNEIDILLDEIDITLRKILKGKLNVLP